MLLQLYRALIHNKVYYGCEAYLSTTATVLRILDPVYNKALTIHSGVSGHCMLRVENHPLHYTLITEPNLLLHPDSCSIPLRTADPIVGELEIYERSHFGSLLSSCWKSPVPPWTNVVELDLIKIGKEERAGTEIRERLL